MRQWIEETISGNTTGLVATEMQLVALESLAKRGQDVVMLSPCGSGKSLPAQMLPFLYATGVIINVCPLLLIMEQHRTQLNA